MVKTYCTLKFDAIKIVSIWYSIEAISKLSEILSLTYISSSIVHKYNVSYNVPYRIHEYHVILVFRGIFNKVSLKHWWETKRKGVHHMSLNNAPFLMTLTNQWTCYLALSPRDINPYTYQSHAVLVSLPQHNIFCLCLVRSMSPGQICLFILIYGLYQKRVDYAAKLAVCI